MNVSTGTAVLDRLLEPVTDCFTPEVARQIAELRADERTEARMEQLADRSTEGTLTENEREEYEAYIDAIDLIGVLQAKARAVLRRETSN